jgi:hypothetical protein
MRYLGYIPIGFLLFGMALGNAAADLVGAPDWIGTIAGGVAGYFGSRAILRARYERDLQ